jgi:hypothetical protein
MFRLHAISLVGLCAGRHNCFDHIVTNGYAAFAIQTIRIAQASNRAGGA